MGRQVGSVFKKNRNKRKKTQLTVTPRFQNHAQLMFDNPSDSPNTINLVDGNRTDGKNIWLVGSVWWLIFAVH